MTLPYLRPSNRGLWPLNSSPQHPHPLQTPLTVENIVDPEAYALLIHACHTSLSDHFWWFDRTLSSAYHPQTDRETERVNQEVETYLRIFCGNQPTDWANHITMAESIHNYCVHSITQKFPFELVLGYNLRLFQKSSCPLLFQPSNNDLKYSRPLETKPKQLMT